MSDYGRDMYSSLDAKAERDGELARAKKEMREKLMDEIVAIDADIAAGDYGRGKALGFDPNDIPGSREKRAGEPATENPKDRIGLTKPSFAAIPPSALVHLGEAMKDGAGKYGRFNWREHPVRADVYYDAAMRHLMKWWDGEEKDPESGVHHLGHAMACLAILLDAQEAGCLKDNRGPAGPAARVMNEHTVAKDE